ncbi:MAG: hypothetical protein V4671_04720 [Armatimonadota bacterium]
MPDLDAIIGSLPLDFLAFLVIFIVYWLTNILKDKYKLARHDVHLVAIGLGIVFNLFRAIAGGTRFPSGFASLPEIVLYGIVFGILASGSHKLIKYLSIRFGFPMYGAEEEPSPVILDPPTTPRKGPDPALASTPEVTINTV